VRDIQNSSPLSQWTFSAITPFKRFGRPQRKLYFQPFILFLRYVLLYCVLSCRHPICVIQITRKQNCALVQK